MKASKIWDKPSKEYLEAVKPMNNNQKLAKEAIKLAEREIKEWTKFLKLAKKILKEI